jgi:hypothetical protein
MEAPVPRFSPQDFYEFACFVYGELEELSERLERLEVRLLEEQLARPAAKRSDDA